MITFAPRASALPTPRDLLVSPGFLFALGMLALNDRVFKALYGNWLTGKLSDFAGLFALTLFLFALVPKQRRLVGVGIAVAFAIWKSPLATPVIAAWNATGLWPVGRVIDLTDLIALVSIPLALAYRERARPVRSMRALRPVAALGALFLFAATSQADEERPDGSLYVLSMSRADFHARLHARDSVDTRFHLYVRTVLDTAAVDTISLSWSGRTAPPYDLGARLTLELRSAVTGETVLTLAAVATPRSEWTDSLQPHVRAWFTDSLLPYVVAPVQPD